MPTYDTQNDEGIFTEEIAKVFEEISDCTPYTLFHKMLSDDIVQLMCDQSMMYAAEYHNDQKFEIQQSNVQGQIQADKKILASG